MQYDSSRFVRTLERDVDANCSNCRSYATKPAAQTLSIPRPIPRNPGVALVPVIQLGKKFRRATLPRRSLVHELDNGLTDGGRFDSQFSSGRAIARVCVHEAAGRTAKAWLGRGNPSGKISHAWLRGQVCCWQVPNS
jgi:hypothetical protein